MSGSAHIVFVSLEVSDLVIDKVMKSCGCARTILGSSNVQPGMSTTLRVIYSNEGTSSTVFNTSVVVKSNAKNTPTKQLKISGNALDPEVDFVPKTISISMLLEDPNQIISVQVNSKKGQSLEITNCEIKDVVFTKDDIIVAQGPFDCQIDNMDLGKVLITASTKSANIGTYKGILELKLKGWGLESFELPLKLVVQPKLSFYPKSFEFIVGQNTMQLYRRICVKANGDTELVIKRIKCPATFPTPTFKKLNNSSSFIYINSGKSKDVSFPSEVLIEVVTEIDGEEQVLEYKIAFKQISGFDM